MDWEGAGLKDRTLSWLESAADARYASERRLDPFATSMRDFDDVSAHLAQVQAGQSPEHRDAKQRLTDLRAAGLVEGVLGAAKLTPIGQAALQAWTAHGLATTAKADELPRAILLFLAARELGAEPYIGFMKYWAELRSSFPATKLINNWDVLYTLNYLDHEIDGYAPGVAYRDMKVSPDDIEFDLDVFVDRVGGSRAAKRGADRIGDAIGGKIPRGRARATFCIAMELIAQQQVPPRVILEAFGYPEKPRKWTAFTEKQIASVEAILKANGLAPAPGAGLDNLDEAEMDLGGSPYSLPKEIDFSAVVQAPPAPKKGAQGTGGRGPKKIDHARRHERNQSVGLLGEEFALRYELWRLRDHEALRSKVSHVSLEDDTLGYDILSWNVDGTERYVEVKSTQGPLETRFFMTASELSCAKENSEKFVLLRVGNLKGMPTCCEVRYPFDELEIEPNLFEVRFKAS